MPPYGDRCGLRQQVCRRQRKVEEQIDAKAGPRVEEVRGCWFVGAKPDRCDAAALDGGGDLGTGAAGDASSEPSTSAQTIKDSYAALTLAERLSIQSDLIWTGDYNGLVNGEFSDRLVAAVQAYERSHPGS